MFPDLSYFFNAVIGTDVDNWTSVFKTFGIFLVISFIAAARILKKELQRKEEEKLIDPIPAKATSSAGLAIREAILNGGIAFLFGFKIPFIWKNFEAFKLDPTGVIFSMQGHLFFGFLFGGLIAMYYYFSAKNLIENLKQQDALIYPHQKVGDIILVAAISGVVGSRLFSVFENYESFIKDPFGQIFNGSGLTVYGGLILGFITVYFYVKRLGIKPVHVMDITGLCFPLAYAIGRMGCHFSGDGDWGIVNGNPKPDWFFFPEWMWSYDYPRNVLMEGVKIKDCVGIYCNKLAEGVYPTPIYEIAGSLLLFFILWTNRQRFKSPGVLFFTFLFINGIQRFLVEMIRVNPRYDLLGLDWSLSQIIAFVFTIIGLIGIFKCKGKKDKKPNEAVNYSQIGHEI